MLSTPSRWLPLAILLGGAAAAWLLAQGRANGADGSVAAPPPTFPFVRVAPGEVSLSVRASGEARPIRTVDLVAEVAGRVESMSSDLKAGSFFAADALLVQIDASDARLALARADALLARAASEWQHAQARLQRLQTLRAREIASSAAGDEASYAERSAQALLREARVARDEARQTLARTSIHAPFAGRVSERRVDPGQFVARGSVLARVHAINAAEVRLPVSLVALEELGLSLAGGEIEAGPEAVLSARLGGGRATWSGRVVRVEGEVSTRTRMLHVIVRVDDPFAPGRPVLAPGLFVEAELVGRRIEAAIALPRDALRLPDQVWVIDEDDRMRARRVDVLRADAENVLVVGGLERGERVCARTLGVIEGLAVRPIELAGETGPIDSVAVGGQ